MPTAHTKYSYTYAELSDAAKVTAVESVAEKLGGEWWDFGDIETLSQTITYALADAIGAPGREKFGAGDYPGTDGITLDGWDLDRGAYVAVSGYLTRENAPGLPWADGIEQVALTASRTHTTIDVEVGDIEFTCTSCGQRAVWSSLYGEYKNHVVAVPGGIIDDEETDADHEPFLLEGLPDREQLCEDFEQTVRAALDTALTAGQKEAEYMTSIEKAQEWVDSRDPGFNEPAFNEDGTML